MFWNQRNAVATWNPWAEIEALQADVNRFFGAIDSPMSADPMPLELAVKDDVARVRAELPGVDRSRIDVSVEGDEMRIAVERPRDEATEGSTWRRTERWSGRVARTLRLPFPVDAARTSARHENGVLTVELPRLESDKPKKIAVEPARS